MIADEPTTALDVTIQAQILELLADRCRQRLGMAVVFITHDLGIVRRIADRVYVMHDGVVMEDGATETIFARPRTDYTRMLLDAEPSGRKAPVDPASPTLIEANDLHVTFTLKTDWLGRPVRRLAAVDGVDIAIRRGQTIGIVGESGSGKSTLGRALLRLVPSDGRIVYLGQELSRLEEEAVRPLRRQLQMVFQDPFGSLSPRLTVGQIIAEGLKVHQPELEAVARDRAVDQAMRAVRLDPSWVRRFPHEFSGGQRQRIAIARAIVLRPDFVLLDEPTSALDRTIQKQIVELLRELQHRNNLTYLFISHDLAVVRAMADTILVMKDGRIVEAGPTSAIFDKPREAYTRQLLAAALGQHKAA